MSAKAMLRKPLLGGVFGCGEFELATQSTICGGLHTVKFMVVQARAGRVLSIGASKEEALSSARRVLRATAANDAEPRWVQPRLWSDAELAVVPAGDPPPRPVSRRRREVFERSRDSCHYCGATLALEGLWHVEHQMPRSLGGDDAPGNLVASCVRYNLAKSDLTAVEFVADGGSQGGRRRAGEGSPG